MIAEKFQISSSRVKKIIIATVFATAIFLIVFHFTDTPKVWVDEGVFTEVAKNVALHNVLGMQTSPGNFFPMQSLLTTGYPVIFPIAVSISVFGPGVWQARIPMLLYMLLLVVAFYLFAKKRYGFSAAIISVLLLISFSPFYGNGRPVQGEAPGLFFVVLGSWLLLLWQEKEWKYIGLPFVAGMAYGFAGATKPIYLMGLGVGCLISVIFWFKKINNVKGVLACVVGFIVPIFIQIAVQFPTKDAVAHIVPLYLHLAANHGSSSSLAQTVIQNAMRFFTESTPILFTLLTVTIFISLVLRYKKKILDKISLAEFIILIFITINVLGYLPGTGWYRYFFPAHVLVYLLFGGAFILLVGLIKKESFKKIIFIIPVALIIFQFFHLIFLSDTSFTVKRTRNANLAEVLSIISPSQKVFFYNTVEAIVFLRGSNYSQYLAMGDFLEAGNKDALVNPVEDYILTDDRYADLSLKCYIKNPVGKYYLFKKIKDCNSKKY